MTSPRTRSLLLLASVSLLAACAAGGPGGFTAARGSLGGNSVAERAARMGDYGTAAALYEQQVAQEPGAVAPMVGLGRAYAGMGALDRAEAVLGDAQSRQPGDAAILLELSRVQLAAGKPKAALASLGRPAPAASAT